MFMLFQNLEMGLCMDGHVLEKWSTKLSNLRPFFPTDTIRSLHGSFHEWHVVKKCSPNHQSDSNPCEKMRLSPKNTFSNLLIMPKLNLGHQKNGLQMLKCSSKSSNPHLKGRIFPQSFEENIVEASNKGTRKK